MPVDFDESNSENRSVSRSQTSTSSTLHSNPPSSRLTGVLEMLRVARETREDNERQFEVSSVELPGVQRRGASTASPIQGYRSVSSIPSATIQTPALTTRRREGVLSYSSREHPHHRLQMSPGERPLRRPSGEGNESPAMNSSNLLRRELDGDDFPSRLAILRSNALSLQESLDAAAAELTLPFTQNRGDSFSARNHHRHSSMSTSPRVLETANPPSLPNRRAESEKARRLEDVLYFLDMQRNLSPDDSQFHKTSRFGSSYVAESSWLRPGGRYYGVQSISGEVPPPLSHLSRQLRLQSAATKEWKVEVLIDQVDYSNMSISGSMKAYDMADNGDRTDVITFWTGEVTNLCQSYICNLAYSEVDRFFVTSFSSDTALAGQCL